MGGERRPRFFMNIDDISLRLLHRSIPAPDLAFMFRQAGWPCDGEYCEVLAVTADWLGHLWTAGGPVFDNMRIMALVNRLRNLLEGWVDDKQPGLLSCALVVANYRFVSCSIGGGDGWFDMRTGQETGSQALESPPYTSCVADLRELLVDYWRRKKHADNMGVQDVKHSCPPSVAPGP